MNSPPALGLGRRFAALGFLMCFILPFAMAGVFLELLPALIDGGIDGAIAKFSQTGTTTVEAILGIIGSSLGFLAGFVLWRWVMLRTGFLSPPQYDELYEPPKNWPY